VRRFNEKVEARTIHLLAVAAFLRSLPVWLVPEFITSANRSLHTTLARLPFSPECLYNLIRRVNIQGTGASLQGGGVPDEDGSTSLGGVAFLAFGHNGDTGFNRPSDPYLFFPRVRIVPIVRLKGYRAARSTALRRMALCAVLRKTKRRQK